MTTSSASSLASGALFLGRGRSYFATAAAPKMWANLTINSVTQGPLTIAKTSTDHELYFDEPVKAGGTNKGPAPLESILSALTGCENFIAHLLAKQKGFKFDKIEFQVTGGIDFAGPMKDAPGVSKTFQTLSVVAKIHTNEDEARVKEFSEEVGKRCPVFQLFKQAGVQITESWVRVPTK